MAEVITVDLDALSSAALRALTSDGTSVTDAVRAALTEAATRYPEPPMYDSRDKRDDENYSHWIARQVSTAPRYTEEQVRVLRAAFIQGARQAGDRGVES